MNLDDDICISENPNVLGGLTPANVTWAFVRVHACYWHPVTWLSHMADVEMFGSWAGGHHLMNAALHGITAGLLFLALYHLTGGFWPAAFTAAAFALHPLRVESVAWACERKDVLCGLFFALALLSYSRYVRRPGWPWYTALMASFVAGLMAKPMLVTLPFVLLLLDFWPLRRLGAGDPGEGRARSAIRVVAEKIPLLAVSVAFSVLTVSTQEQAMHAGAGLSLGVRIANAFVSYAAYLRQTIWPTDMAIHYPHPLDHLPADEVAASVALVVGLTVFSGLMWRRAPYVLVGWLWFLGMLVPVIGLVQSGRQARGDRFTYLPQVGLWLGLAWGVADLTSRGLIGRSAVTAAATAVLLVWAYLSWEQAGYWRDNEAVYHHALGCTRGNDVVHLNLGIALDRQGRTEEAVEHYKAALAINPALWTAENNLGACLRSRGRAREAMDHFLVVARSADEGIPVGHRAAACYNLGLCLAELGRYEEAAVELRQAVALDGNSGPALHGLAMALDRLGRYEEAAAPHRKALALMPTSPEAVTELAGNLYRRGQLAEAATLFQKATELKPNDAGAESNLGLVLADLGRRDEALTHLRRALDINPGFVPAIRNTALVLERLGRREEAAEWARKADAATARP